MPRSCFPSQRALLVTAPCRRGGHALWVSGGAGRLGWGSGEGVTGRFRARLSPCGTGSTWSLTALSPGLPDPLPSMPRRLPGPRPLGTGLAWEPLRPCLGRGHRWGSRCSGRSGNSSAEAEPRDTHDGVFLWTRGLEERSDPRTLKPSLDRQGPAVAPRGQEPEHRKGPLSRPHPAVWFGAAGRLQGRAGSAS